LTWTGARHRRSRSRPCCWPSACLARRDPGARID
jgi:hypothetical protein